MRWRKSGDRDDANVHSFGHFSMLKHTLFVQFVDVVSIELYVPFLCSTRHSIFERVLVVALVVCMFCPLLNGSFTLHGHQTHSLGKVSIFLFSQCNSLYFPYALFFPLPLSHSRSLFQSWITMREKTKIVEKWSSAKTWQNVLLSPTDANKRHRPRAPRRRQRHKVWITLVTVDVSHQAAPDRPSHTVRPKAIWTNMKIEFLLHI